jgi:hypothetical protein
MRVLAIFICLATVLCIFPSSSLSRVIVYDTVVPAGQKIMLRAETSGRLFRKGGELVEFFVDGKSIGKTLSGGDGVAFKQFTSAKTGLRQISVRSDKDEDTGLLLSLKKGSSIVFVDVEGSLLEGLFSGKPKHGSQKAIKEIHKRYPIVYLQTSLIGVRAVKEWLEENEFPKLPVVPWRQGSIFKETAGKGFRIKAIIASSKVIESAEEHKPLALNFEASEGAEMVKDWEEISKKLQ